MGKTQVIRTVIENLEKIEGNKFLFCEVNGLNLADPNDAFIVFLNQIRPIVEARAKSAKSKSNPKASKTRITSSIARKSLNEFFSRRREGERAHSRYSSVSHSKHTSYSSSMKLICYKRKSLTMSCILFSIGLTMLAHGSL